MKTDRLIGILVTLLRREKITANELADKFEVSKRTILRDLDDLCMAGIPVITTQGGGGGISIEENYNLDRSMLTYEELERVVTGLRGIGSVHESNQIEALIEKLSPGKQTVANLGNYMVIDLASFYKGSISDKLSKIKEGISSSRCISFDYYTERGRSERVIEPYYIIFKWESWYVVGWCLERKAFRMFKFGRLWNVQITDERFIAREVPTDQKDRGQHLTDEYEMQLLVEPEMEYRLVETYGPECYEAQEDGRLLYSGSYTNREFIIRWILEFGDKAEVAGPAELRAEVAARLRRICSKYEER